MIFYAEFIKKKFFPLFPLSNFSFKNTLQSIFCEGWRKLTKANTCWGKGKGSISSKHIFWMPLSSTGLLWNTATEPSKSLCINLPSLASGDSIVSPVRVSIRWKDYKTISAQCFYFVKTSNWNENQWTSFSMIAALGQNGLPKHAQIFLCN